MSHYHKPNKSKQEWETEMLACLEAARKRIALSSGEERLAAVEHYREVLRQFQSLTLLGEIPPEAPCYT